jgi:hypothetical protein
LIAAEPFQPDSWLDTLEQRSRDAAGEYFPVAFLADGGLAVVTSVQDPTGPRYGFAWRHLAATYD